MRRDIDDEYDWPAEVRAPLTARALTNTVDDEARVLASGEWADEDDAYWTNKRWEEREC